MSDVWPRPQGRLIHRVCGGHEDHDPDTGNISVLPAPADSALDILGPDHGGRRRLEPRDDRQHPRIPLIG